jgi:predicted Zn-dependent peptidase
MKKIIYIILVILILGLNIMAQDLYSNIKEWKLENGTDIITYNKTTSNICAINIGFKLPISVENDKNVGLRNLLIKVMARNTKDYNAFELSKAIDNIGAGVSPVISKDYIGLAATSLCQYTPKLLSILNDILYNPSFEGFDEEKNIAIQQASMLKRIWSEILDLWTFKSLQTPYRYETIGYPETIKNIEKTDIISLYNKYFTGNNLVIVLAGNLDHIDNLEGELGKFNIKMVNKETVPSPVEPPLKENKYVEKRKVDSSAFALGLDAPTRGSDDYIKWSVFTTYLSNKMDDEIRQKRGLAYSAYATIMNLISNSYLIVSSDLNDPTKMNEAIEIANNYLTSKYIDNITDKDFNLAKNMVIGSLSRANQTSGEIASDIFLNYLYKLPLNYTNILLDKAKAISKEDIISLGKIIPGKVKSEVEIISTSK